MRRYLGLARRFARRGYLVELQVRYHPDAAQEGDLSAWREHVRDVVRRFGRIRAVIALQIANEVNISFSPDSSDGAYQRAPAALVEGVIAAKREVRRLRLRPPEDRLQLVLAPRRGDRAALLGGAARPRRQRASRGAVDWIGLDAYPGTVFPPSAPLGGERDAMVSAMRSLRCFARVPGIPSSDADQGRGERLADAAARARLAEQAQRLRAMVRAVNDYRGTFGVSDYRWFNLRDADSAAPTPVPALRAARVRLRPETGVRRLPRSRARARREGLGFAMTWDLRGKTVLITGAARGIGAETARRAAAGGANVALVGLEPEELQRVAAQCGTNAAAFECDVTDWRRAGARGRGHGRALRRDRRGDGQRRHRPGGHGPLDRPAPPSSARSRSTCSASGAPCAPACPQVIERKGYVLVTASLAAAIHGAGHGRLLRRKAGAEAFADSLRIEVKHLGVDVGVAYFGFIDTDMVRAADAHPALGALRANAGGPIAKTYPVSQVGQGGRRGDGEAQPLGRGATLEPRAAGAAHGALAALRPGLVRDRRRGRPSSSSRTSTTAAPRRPPRRSARAARRPASARRRAHRELAERWRSATPA